MAIGDKRKYRANLIEFLQPQNIFSSRLIYDFGWICPVFRAQMKVHIELNLTAHMHEQKMEHDNLLNIFCVN